MLEKWIPTPLVSKTTKTLIVYDSATVGLKLAKTLDHMLVVGDVINDSSSANPKYKLVVT